MAYQFAHDESAGEIGETNPYICQLRFSRVILIPIDQWNTFDADK